MVIGGANICQCGRCAECRLMRFRASARERKRRERSVRHYADACLPLFDVTEQDGWIERRLRALDQARQRMRRGWAL